MKNSKFFLWLLLLCSAASAGSVWAHDRGRGPRVGVYVGIPFAYPWHAMPPPYYSPYYYYPPQVIVRPEPQVYIERAAPQPAPQPQAQPQTQAYWYYCTNPQGYYPYVKDCPGGWLQVVPTPPN